MSPALPLATFWFLYLGAMGVQFPYLSLYLHENAGLGGTQVGIVLAVLPAVGLLAQPFWGVVSDRSGLRSRLLALLALGAACGQLVLRSAEGFVAIVLATLVLAAFHTPAIPMTVALTLAALRERGAHAFGRVRVWGTLGFLLFVVSFPMALHRVQEARGWERTPGGPSEPGLENMFLVTAFLAICAAGVALLVPREGAVMLRAPRGDWRRLLRHAPFRRVLLFALLAYLFLQGPIGLFPVYVRAQGGDMDTVSRMWIAMLLLEIPLVALSGASVQRLGSRGLLAMGVIAGGLRWTVCGLTDQMWAIYAASLLHGPVVAGLVLGAPLYVERTVPERLRSTGQGLLAMVGVSVGGIASNVGAGWLLERHGAEAPYLVGGGGALLLALLLPVLLPRPVRAAEDGPDPGAHPAP